MKKKIPILMLSLFFVVNIAYSSEQKQYLQTMKENEIKEQQERKQAFQEGKLRDGIMERIYGRNGSTGGNTVIEFNAPDPSTLPRECWGGPCRD